MRIVTKFNRRSRTLTPSSELTRQFLTRLANMVGCPEQAVLVELWRNWPVIMGEEIGDFCLPLGHKGKRLEVGCEDSMAMQELQFRHDEILERANSFMESDFFNDLKISLVLGRKTLWQTGNQELAEAKKPNLYPGAAVGTWLDTMDPESPIARCYRAYCRKDNG